MGGMGVGQQKQGWPRVGGMGWEASWGRAWSPVGP